MAGLEVRSTAFADHDLMPDRLSRDGGNASPPLAWYGKPESVTEFVVLCEDADAGDTPAVHWLVTGIGPNISALCEGEIPIRSRQWPNSFGEADYTGPHPPKGDNPHRYFFRVYAVNGPLNMPDKPKSPDVHRAVEEREVASGVIVGTFAR